MRAFLALRDGLPYRREAFIAGLESLGYKVQIGCTTSPKPDDVFVSWNLYAEKLNTARVFESAGRPVLVAENGYLGNDFAGSRWYAISRNQHNGAGKWPHGGPERWDSLNVPLAPWREPDGEIVVLPQRGIGPPGTAMPRDWLARTEAQLAGMKYRVRRHPGVTQCISLEDDLRNASAVCTWGSGAALKALTMGIPVYSDMPNWIGYMAALPLKALKQGLRKTDDIARREVLRSVAWAMWRLEEITDGTAFRRLLG
jgi:hypothetical protein